MCTTSGGLLPGHSVDDRTLASLKARLKLAREEQGLTAKRVAELVGEKQGRGPLHENTIYYWESLKREPAIDAFRDWAEVLGYRLIVDLDSGAGGRFSVLLSSNDAAEAARLFESLAESDRGLALDFIRRLSRTKEED